MRAGRLALSPGVLQLYRNFLVLAAGNNHFTFKTTEITIELFLSVKLLNGLRDPNVETLFQLIFIHVCT